MVGSFCGTWRLRDLVRFRFGVGNRRVKGSKARLYLLRPEGLHGLNRGGSTTGDEAGDDRGAK
jgi:hypothetical protein